MFSTKHHSYEDEKIIQEPISTKKNYAFNYLRLLSSNIDQSSEERERIVQKCIAEGDNVALVEITNSVYRSIKKWACNLKTSVQASMDFYYELQKDKPLSKNILGNLTKEESELLKLAENFDIELLNVCSEEESELLTLSELYSKSFLPPIIIQQASLDSAKVRSKPSFNQLVQEDDIMPIFIAAENGDVDAINTLKAKGANVNMPNSSGFTPVYIAAYYGHANAITALEAAGANVNTPNRRGATPVFIAAFEGHASAIVALSTAGANVNTPNEDGYTPIYIAARQGHAEAISALKAAGANVNMPNKGITPLWVSTSMGHTTAITALLEAGADASIKTKWGSALKKAREGKKPRHPEIVRLLETHLQQYPNGIKLVIYSNTSVSFSANSIEKKGVPVLLTQFNRLAVKPDPKFEEDNTEKTDKGKRAILAEI
jgi:ankyrin repeat protein